MERSQGVGSSPTNVSVTPDGCDLLSADSGEDAVAVFALSRAKGCGQGAKKGPKKKKQKKQRKGGKKSTLAVAQPASKHKKKGKGKSNRRKARPFQLVGRIPTGSYPTAVAATPKRRQLVWVSARGLGVGPNPGGPNPDTGDDTYLNQYLPSIVTGASGVLNYPSDQQDPQAHPDRRAPGDPGGRPDARRRTPRSVAGGPIKHVFYIVRENRTYDQVLGDDPRGDGDPSLTLFDNSITPNLHALAQRFPLLDHVYANSEASIDGHYWTAAGAVSDYVTKNWHQNYAGRNRPYDFGSYVVSAPPKGYIFQRMLQGGGLLLQLRGERWPASRRSPTRTGRLRRPTENGQVLNISRQRRSAQRPSAATTATSRFSIPRPSARRPGTSTTRACRRGRTPATHRDSTASRRGSKTRSPRIRCRPSTTSLCPLDHTQGLEPGKRTPNADIANNDWGLGADGRRDLPFPDLEQLADPRRRGRFAERRRSRRRAPHPGAGDQSLHRSRARWSTTATTSSHSCAPWRSSPACNPRTSPRRWLSLSMTSSPRTRATRRRTTRSCRA